MKTIKFLSVAVCASVVLSSCNKSGGVSNEPIKTELDSVSYAAGVQMADQVLKAGFEEVNVARFTQGFNNAMDSTNVQIEIEESGKILNKYFLAKRAEMQKKQQEDAVKRAEEKFNDNKVAGENFLEENKSKDGVQTTASGLQYIVQKEGSGEKPGPTTKVKVHYHGTTINGEVFDSSVDRGKPSEFGLNQVIKGWTEGLQLMSPGAKYKFFIPQELAYGPQQKGAMIKPFSALVFEVELLEILN